MQNRERTARPLHWTLLLAPLVVISCLMQGGCAWMKAVGDQLAYCEPVDDLCAATRIRLNAHRVWWERRDEICVSDEPHQHDLKRGFVDGFSDVASGGKGCVPPLPPRRYWRSSYETEEGRCKIAAYFKGFSLGVQFAFQLGHANVERLPMSMTSIHSPSCPNCPSSEHPDLRPISPIAEPVDLDQFLLPPPVPPLPPRGLSPMEGERALPEVRPFTSHYENLTPENGRKANWLVEPVSDEAVEDESSEGEKFLPPILVGPNFPITSPMSPNL